MKRLFFFFPRDRPIDFRPSPPLLTVLGKHRQEKDDFGEPSVHRPINLPHFFFLSVFLFPSQASRLSLPNFVVILTPSTPYLSIINLFLFSGAIIVLHGEGCSNL
ncbi:hypothetical protein L6452_23494 [Arctium lappa]|uniref:Uncharacterized protein n=1 Tax=Arctium lappa TaxID=4217 RepID=A0ACB9B185_ARCLA|nr:hypothetical protein L6452_23494 [Arctium lappa]